MRDAGELHAALLSPLALAGKRIPASDPQRPAARAFRGFERQRQDACAASGAGLAGRRAEDRVRVLRLAGLLPHGACGRNACPYPMPRQPSSLRCLVLEKQGVKVEVFDEKKLKEIGADALLAVGQGSSNPPRMVVMQWQGSEDEPIVLVGKGICFDAGGINLKTSHLPEMKWDKAGAGVVVGVIDVVSKMKSPINVVAIAMLAENMPDGAALKPGDVITTLGGKRVEIIDTDCEGRLALADGLSYAQKMFSPKALIDLGTLTLEVFGALGGEYAGLFCGMHESLSKSLLRAGDVSGEKLWPLPLGEYYAKQIRSKIADLKNVGTFRYGGALPRQSFCARS